MSIDEHGFVTIRGRAKRFAKIAGEMVSLSAVEGYVSDLWPDYLHAVVSIPDPKKGEQLILVTEQPDASREPLLAYAKDQGIAEIMVPKTIRIIDRIPVLGTGKLDYVGVKNLVETAP